MGVDDLWKFCIPGVKAKPQQPFSSAKNTRVAVDISCLLHVCIARPKVALLINCVPSFTENFFRTKHILIIKSFEYGHSCTKTRWMLFDE